MSKTGETQALAIKHGLEFKHWTNGKVRLSDGDTIVIYYPESINRMALVMGGARYKDCTPKNAIDICLNRIAEIQIRVENGEYHLRPPVKMNEVRK